MKRMGGTEHSPVRGGGGGGGCSGERLISITLSIGTGDSRTPFACLYLSSY